MSYSESQHSGAEHIAVTHGVQGASCRAFNTSTAAAAFTGGAVGFPTQLVTHACGRRSQRHFQASLGVREISAARSLAIHLTVRSEVIFAEVKAGMLSTNEANTILQGEIKRLRARFAALSALDLADGRRAEEARRDRIAAAGYALIAARGMKFEISPSDRERLQAEGLQSSEIDEIHPFLAGYAAAGLLPPPPAKITRLLRQRGLPDTAVNTAQAETLYLRAMAIALREQADCLRFRKPMARAAKTRRWGPRSFARRARSSQPINAV